jgi:3-dehydroquinate synthase
VFPAEVPALVVAGGEACKNGTAALDAVLRHIHDSALCRKSMLLAIGGGALLDVAGFAAATAHRGIRLGRIATTTVSQGDSCVGVKNGINFFGKKNYLGTFAVPDLVVCDEALLASLGERDWRAGFSEAVKVALIRDAGFLDEIRAAAPAIRRRDLAAASPVLRKSAELHLRHIALGGDPFELTSARPLDFGHWAAHKLEQLTGFAVLHGEAVAIGVALDSAISRELGLVTSDDLDAILACLEALGFSLWHEAMEDEAALAAGIEEFREHLGGSLTLSMLDGIGGERLVHALPSGALSAALRRLRARRPEPAGASR